MVGVGTYNVTPAVYPPIHLAKYCTVSIWARPGDTTQTNTGIMVRDHAGDSKRSFRLMVHTTAGNYAFTASTAAGNATVFSPTGYTTGRFQHLVGTFDGTNVMLYVNGVVVASSGMTGQLNQQPTLDLRFGRDSQGALGYFVGRYTNAALWNRALEQDEISTLYANPFAHLAPVMRRRWVVEEAVQAETVDQSFVSFGW